MNQVLVSFGDRNCSVEIVLDGQSGTVLRRCRNAERRQERQNPKVSWQRHHSPEEINDRTLMSGTYLMKSAVLWVSGEGIP